MEKKVIYRDRQHLEHTDLNNTQDWADEALSHVVTDAVTAEKQFTGLAVTASSATEITLSAGRLIDGSSGKVYALEEPSVLSLFSILPLQDQKWLAISVLGSSDDTNTEPRDFLIDLDTRQVEPQVVAMQHRRVVIPNIAQGLESTTPEKPAAPTGYVLIAHVRLSPAGIQEIILAQTTRLPNLNQVNQRLIKAEGWITSAEPRLATIMTDISGMSSELAQRARLEQVTQLGFDMANIKERLEIPDDYVFYGADHFLDLAESDGTAPGYSANIMEGIRPPFDAVGVGQLALLNPLEPAAKRFDLGYIMPAYTETTRLRMEHRAGELTINQYQYVTTQATQKMQTRTRIRYGSARTVCTNSAFWNSGRYDPATGVLKVDGDTWQVDPKDYARTAINHQFVRVTQFWTDQWNEPYWDIDTTEHTVQGSQLAQTFLSAQTGWLTSAEIYLTGVAADGALNALITETSAGLPDMEKVVAITSIAAAELAGGWQKIQWADPVYLEAGKRYALVLITGGAHRVGTTLGTEYTQGLLLYAQDDAYFSDADDRDLMLRLNFARFNTTRAVIQMAPLQLAGGINDIDILLVGWTPPGCQFWFEYQLNGVWTRIAGDIINRLTLAPPLLPLRAVFLGTTDLMPGINPSSSLAVVARYGTQFTHISTERTLAVASSNIRVRVLCEYFDPAMHTINCQLISGGTTIDADQTQIEPVNPIRGDRWVEFRFTPAAAIGSYQIKLIGQTNDANHGWHVAERYDLAL